MSREKVDLQYKRRVMRNKRYLVPNHPAATHSGERLPIVLRKDLGAAVVLLCWMPECREYVIFTDGLLGPRCCPADKFPGPEPKRAKQMFKGIIQHMKTDRLHWYHRAQRKFEVRMKVKGRRKK